MRDLAVQFRPIESLIPCARNSRTHSDAQIAQIAASIAEFGFTNPVLADEKGIVAGHGRILGARQLYRAGQIIRLPSGDELPQGTVPWLDCSGWSQTKRRAYIIADNKLAENAGWDSELLALELGEIQADGFDLDLIGFDAVDLDSLLNADGTDGTDEHGPSPSLAERFGVAPFSVLDARRGWWQERKRGWLASGIASEAGRDDMLTFSLSAQPPHAYEAKNRYEAAIGRVVSWQEFADAHPEAIVQNGTSVFDPVLCELAYRWFCPPGGQVLDPFAGGSVRGWMAAKTGRRYIGCDLRAEQIEANRAQWAAANPDDGANPVWVCGDSREIGRHAPNVQADFLFSCPPYADLERYSKDPADLSNMDYPAFIEAYREIIRKSVALLKQDRFACFVVGEVRGKNGVYRNFVADTIAAFIAAGASYYNEAILVTQAGSLAIRAAEGFVKSRKMGKTHQNVLVFVKGDPKTATAACGPVEIDPALFEAEALE